MVLGTNVSGTRMRSMSGETGTKLVKIMTFVVYSCFTKTIRKEIKSESFKAMGRGGGASRDGQEVRND